MHRLNRALRITMFTGLVASIALTGCGKSNKNNSADNEQVEQSSYGAVADNDVLDTGGKFRKLVVNNKSLSSSSENITNADTEQDKDSSDTDTETEPTQVVSNPALRDDIGLASMNLADLKGNRNVSEDKSGESSKSESTLDNYTKYNLKYNTGCTVNDFEKSIRYFCWSLPDDASNTFVNALAEICKEHGYLHDGLEITKNTYHTKDYKQYIYEVANKDHVITIAIDYNNTKEVWYTTKDKD